MKWSKSASRGPLRFRRGCVLAVAVAIAISVTGQAREFGHYPRPMYFYPSHDIEAESPVALATTFDAVVTSTRTSDTWLSALDAADERVMILAFVSGTTVHDTLSGFAPDDSSDVLGHRRVFAVENDWFLHDVDGRPITTWVTGPWGRNWLLNLTPHAAEDDAGDRFGEWNGRALARAMTTGVGEFVPSAAWDGLMLDEVFDSITWLESRFDNGEIDADRDGVPDDNATVNEAWRAETAIMLGELRDRLGDDVVISMNGETRVLGDVDGASFEECLHNRTWWTDMYGYGDGHGGYLAGIERCRPGPNRFGVFYARYFEGISSLPFDQFARLAAGSSALGDGYYILERWVDGALDAVETAEAYAFDWGRPLGPMHRTVVDGDTLYGRAFDVAYVEVNPYPWSVNGVAARDIRVTEVAPPPRPTVTPTQTSVTFRFPRQTDAVVGIDVRYDVEPITEDSFDDAMRVPLGGVGERHALDAFDATLDGLVPDAAYHVSSRVTYPGGLRSPISTSLAFRTLPETPGWEPPFGAGPEGDDRWDSSWRGRGTNRPVAAIAVDDNSVTVAGEFTDVAGVPAYGVARLENGGWRPLDTDDLSEHVRSVVSWNDLVVVAGSFEADGPRTAGVAAWDGGWVPLGAGLDGVVDAVVVVGGRLVAAGTFALDDQARPRIAGFDGEAWLPIGDDDAGTRFLSLGATASWNGAIVAPAALAGGTHVVRWTGLYWEPLGGVVDGTVSALLGMPNGSLVVAGNFGSIDDVAANNVARWAGGEWRALGTGLDAPVHALERLDGLDGLVVAGGEFTHAGADPVRHLGRWDGSYWTPIGTGVNGVVTAIDASGDGVVVGGRFEEAGVLPVSNVANWGVTIDAITPHDGSDGVDAHPTPNEPAVRAWFASGGATIEWAVSVPSEVRVDVVSVTGRRLAVLADGEAGSGVYTARWDGRDWSGNDVASGVYFVRLRAGTEERRTRLVLVR